MQQRRTTIPIINDPRFKPNQSVHWKQFLSVLAVLARRQLETIILDGGDTATAQFSPFRDFREREREKDRNTIYVPHEALHLRALAGAGNHLSFERKTLANQRGKSNSYCIPITCGAPNTRNHISARFGAFFGAGLGLSDGNGNGL